MTRTLTRGLPRTTSRRRRALALTTAAGTVAACLAAAGGASASSASGAAKSATAGGAVAAAATNPNYAEALQKSFFFYEANMSGHLPKWNRVSWRGDATVHDGADVGVDLSGGYYDAGDHVKFGFPMASAVTTLAWGGWKYRAGYRKSKQLKPFLNNLRWATDYLVKAHAAPSTLYVQVGDGNADHTFWGPPEVVEARKIPRPAYAVTADCPGTDVAAETASALAASSLVFAKTDAAYAKTLLTHAQQLFTMADRADNKNGKENAYVNCVKAAANFYNSTGEGGQATGATKNYWDELAYASIWLYRATKDASYLAKAKAFYPKMGTEPDVGGGAQVPVYSFGLGWNDKEYAVYEAMAELTGEKQYKDDVQRYLDYWTVGYKGKKGEVTPQGLAIVFWWGALRMAANTALVAMTYADHLGPKNPLYARYHDFAKRQADYALGVNGDNQSYMVGFGAKSPHDVHHRGAHGSWADSSQTGPPEHNRHTLYGALVGGPDADGAWEDDRSDFIKNEVAIDYNAGITSLLARLTKEYGGTPLSSIPKEKPDGPEIYLDTTIEHTASGTSAHFYLTNMSAWPARVLDKATVRYFFTLDGTTKPAQITASLPYSQCKGVSGPTQWSGATYYVTVDCTGTDSFPGGNQYFRREAQLSISSTGSWTPSNDWSSKPDQLVLYQAGKRIWGTEPPKG